LKNITISGVQFDIIWEFPDENLFFLENDVLPKVISSDIIVLPEMFTTGFTLNAPTLSEQMSGRTVQWLSDMAAVYNCHMVGSIIINTQQLKPKYTNRLIWAHPDGTISWYDKHHLFSIGEEHTIYSAGQHQLTVTVNGWKIRPFICYDLRFPAWTRNVKPFFDISIFIANWPEKRSYHWKTLLSARAIENQCFVMGVNRIGTDDRNLHYSGDSILIDPKGKPIVEMGSSFGVFSHTLEYSSLQNWRQQFPALQDADAISITI